MGKINGFGKDLEDMKKEMKEAREERKIMIDLLRSIKEMWGKEISEKISEERGG